MAAEISTWAALRTTNRSKVHTFERSQVSSGPLRVKGEREKVKGKTTTCGGHRFDVSVFSV